MKKKELTTEERMEIVTWHKAGKSVREISTSVGWLKSTIQDTIQRWRKTGFLQSKARLGRPPKVTATMKKRIDRYLERKDEAVSKEVVRDLKAGTVERSARGQLFRACSALFDFV
jgi:transposase